MKGVIEMKKGSGCGKANLTSQESCDVEHEQGFSRLGWGSRARQHDPCMSHPRTGKSRVC